MAKQKDEVIDYDKNLEFEEIEIRRISTRSQDDEGNAKTIVTFEMLKKLRPRVVISTREANALNRGKLEHPSNEIFTVLVPKDNPQQFEDWKITMVTGKNTVYSWPNEPWM